MSTPNGKRLGLEFGGIQNAITFSVRGFRLVLVIGMMDFVLTVTFLC